jgi:excisionase family DNA binding protein
VARDLGYRLIREGRLKAVRLGERKLLIPASELEAFVARETHTPPDDAGFDDVPA